MTSGYKNSSQVDLDNIFSLRATVDPSANATGYVTSNGLDLASRYYPLQAGMTPLAATGFNTLVSGVSTDLCNIFAPLPIWYTVGTGIVTGTRIESICAVDASNIYAAGIFTNAGGAAVTNVAKWNGTAWSSLGFSSAAFANNALSITITAIPGSNVFMSYQIRNVGAGRDEPYISMYNFSTWSNLTGVIAAMGATTTSKYINDMCLLDSNTLFVCADTFSASVGLAKYTISTATWAQIGTGLSTSGSVIISIAKLSSTQILVGGVLSGAITGIAVFNNTNSQWTQFIASYSFGEINSISVVSPTVVFVGSSTGLHRINDAGTGWVNTAITNGWSSANVTSVYAVNSTNVFIAGDFNTSPYRYVARWNGTSAVSLANGVATGSVLYSVAGTGTRNVYFGGTFTSVNNLSGALSALRIAKWA